MEHNKQTEVNVKFDEGDVYSVSVHSASYSNRITISTRDNDNINLKFADQAALRKFVSMVVTAAHNNEWQREYSSNYVYPVDSNLITLDELTMWEMSHSEHEARAEAYRAENS